VSISHFGADFTALAFGTSTIASDSIISTGAVNGCAGGAGGA
jgi:hypothetical protein